MKVLFGFQAEQNNYKDIAAEKLGVIYPGKRLSTLLPEWIQITKKLLRM